MAATVSLTQAQAALKQRQKVAGILIFTAIPLLLAAYTLFFPKQAYLPISVAILAVTVIPFFLIFEKRKPKARELVFIAVLCGLTTFAQLGLHIVFPVQIGTALIIICGASLGCEAGFLIGALARFLCNFYMGHGPWTPWQMFCWGILGFLAGYVFQKNAPAQAGFSALKPWLWVVFCLLGGYIGCFLFLPSDSAFQGWKWYAFGALGLLLSVIFQKKHPAPNTLSLFCFTFVSTFIVYGGIMNLCAMVTSATIPQSGGFGWGTLRALYLSAVPYDLYHAGTAALCVVFLGKGMIQKLERIKIKYGIYR